MKRVRSINGDTSGGKQSKAAAGGKKSKTTMMAKAAPPDQNCRPGSDHNPVHHPDSDQAADVASTISNAAHGLAAAEAAAAVMEKREEEEAAVGREWYYSYNCGGGDYEQMWWGSIWLPNWDVENYLVDDFVAGDNAAAAAVGWDIDDIWNFKGGSTNYY